MLFSSFTPLLPHPHRRPIEGVTLAMIQSDRLLIPLDAALYGPIRTPKRTIDRSEIDGAELDKVTG